MKPRPGVACRIGIHSRFLPWGIATKTIAPDVILLLNLVEKIRRRSPRERLDNILGGYESHFRSRID
jgi:hypothetical protein